MKNKIAEDAAHKKHYYRKFSDYRIRSRRALLVALVLVARGAYHVK